MFCIYLFTIYIDIINYFTKIKKTSHIHKLFAGWKADEIRDQELNWNGPYVLFAVN